MRRDGPKFVASSHYDADTHGWRAPPATRPLRTPPPLLRPLRPMPTSSNHSCPRSPPPTKKPKLDLRPAPIKPKPPQPPRPPQAHGARPAPAAPRTALARRSEGRGQARARGRRGARHPRTAPARRDVAPPHPAPGHSDSGACAVAPVRRIVPQSKSACRNSTTAARSSSSRVAATSRAYTLVSRRAAPRSHAPSSG